LTSFSAEKVVVSGSSVVVSGASVVVILTGRSGMGGCSGIRLSRTERTGVLLGTPLPEIGEFLESALVLKLSVVGVLCVVSSVNRVVGISVVVSLTSSSSKIDAAIVVGRDTEVAVVFDGVGELSVLREEVVKNLSETEIILIV
jgi:hypothetical protein